MNECDVQYKNSKNQRLTVELAIMKMCALHKVPEGASPVAPEKKKSLAEPTPKAETPVVEQPIKQEDPTPVQNQVAAEPIQASESTSEPEIQDTVETEESSPEDNSAQPEPEQIPQTSKTVALRGRRRIKGAGIRISEAHLATQEEEIDINSLPKDAFTEEQMQNIWNERVNLLFRSSPSMLSSLTKHPPKLKEDHTIELELDGAHQLEQLQESKTILIDAIRKDLNNFSIQLETPVKEVVTKKKAYTPKEIYHQLATENPHLETLRKEFGLDLDI